MNALHLYCRSSSITNALDRSKSQSIVSTNEVSESRQVSADVTQSVEDSTGSSETQFEQVGPGLWDWSWCVVCKGLELVCRVQGRGRQVKQVGLKGTLSVSASK